MSKKYTIKLKKNVKYPDVSNTVDTTENYIFSNQKLRNVISTQILDQDLQHPLFENFTDKKLANLKKNARYVVSFPCEGNNELDEKTYGLLAKTFGPPRKNCSNGSYSYSASLKNNRFVFLNDPFAGSNDNAIKPNLTVRFEEISKQQFNILYNLSIKIELEIKCKNNIELIELDAFIEEPGSNNNVPYTNDTATFLVSTDDKSTKVHTTYQYGIAEETILTRVLSPYNNSSRKKIYNWEAIPGKKQLATLLLENYARFEPLTIQEFEFISFDENGKAVIPKHSLPDIGDADDGFDNSLRNRLNNLIFKFLNARIKQLQHTLQDEVIKKYTGNNAVAVMTLLNNCDTTIQVSGFNIPNNDNRKGLYIGRPETMQYGGQPTQYRYAFIKTEQDILDLFTSENLK